MPCNTSNIFRVLCFFIFTQISCPFKFARFVKKQDSKKVWNTYYFSPSPEQEPAPPLWGLCQSMCARYLPHNTPPQPAQILASHAGTLASPTKHDGLKIGRNVYMCIKVFHFHTSDWNFKLDLRKNSFICISSEMFVFGIFY